MLFRPRVSRLVVFELLFCYEGLPAAGIGATVRFVPGVAVDVSCQLGLVAEGFDLAASGPVAVIVSAGLAIVVFSGVVRCYMPVQVLGRGIVVVARNAVV